VTLFQYAAATTGGSTLSCALLIASGLVRPHLRLALIAGAGLATLNTIGSFALVVWSARRSAGAFLAALLGGMVVRMGAMLAALVVAVLYLGLPGAPLAVALLSYFVLFLILELAVLQRTARRPAEGR
jgi:hypothetical protein